MKKRISMLILALLLLSCTSGRLISVLANGGVSLYDEPPLTEEDPNNPQLEVGPNNWEICFNTNDVDGGVEITQYIQDKDGPCSSSDITIPSKIGGKDVVAIGNGAFNYNGLTSVTIPDSIIRIEDNAFSNNQLISVIIPDSVTSIGNSAFAYNRQLTSVIIPNSVTSIEDFAFYESALISVIIPDSVTSIGNGAFFGNQLTSVTISNSITGIADNSFAENELTSITIPDSVISIGNSAFFKNQLSSVIIPDSVTTIGEGAFNQNQLTSVTISNSISSIAFNTFASNKLSSVIIPDSVTDIKVHAFYNNQLTSITIPDSVTNIENGAFNQNQLTSITIPNSVTNIENRAFGNNPGIPGIGKVKGETNIPYNQRETINQDSNNFYFVQLGSEIYTWTFDPNNGEATIVVTGHLGDLITSPTPESDTLVFLKREPNIASPALMTGNRSFTAQWGVSTPEKCFGIEALGTGVKIIKYYREGGYEGIEGCNNRIKIPETLGGLDVLAIGNNSFNNNELTSVIIPNSVTSIGNSAFAFNQLTSVIIPDSVTIIGDRAFIGNELNSIRIPDSVTSIGNSAFAFNQLTSVIIPDSVRTIGNEAFSANQLSSVKISNSITHIEDVAFAFNQLTSVTIPDSVISIGEGAFAFNQLISITIPSSVTSIGDRAFMVNYGNRSLGDGQDRDSALGEEAVYTEPMFYDQTSLQDRNYPTMSYPVLGFSKSQEQIDQFNAQSENTNLVLCYPTIIFNFKDGDNTLFSITGNYNSEFNTTLINEPNKKGFRFKGWNKELPSLFEEDTIFTAIWEEIESGDSPSGSRENSSYHSAAPNQSDTNNQKQMQILKNLESLSKYLDGAKKIAITRGDFARIIVILEQAGFDFKKPKTNTECLFEDETNFKTQEATAAKKVCERGIMGIGTENKLPLKTFGARETLTYQEFATILSRMLFGYEYENNGSNYYEGAVQTLETLNLLSPQKNGELTLSTVIKTILNILSLYK